VTLVDVLQAVREMGPDEQETVATMVHLLTSAQVRLTEGAVRTMTDLLATMHAAA